ncbi:MAG: 4-hydroxy-tetrahydrodipicolinate reductase, partial [bacterium]
MKIALIGYGKMGRLIEEVARRHEMEVVARFTRAHPFRADDQTHQALNEVTTLIDFSAPDAVLENIRTAAALSFNLVIGTTGWHSQLEEARKI